MKSKTTDSKKLFKFRRVISIFTLSGLLLPFIMQQTFYPFFRFGMFAEPVKRSIQTEQFFLAAIQKNGNFDLQIAEKTGIQKSKLSYLLRNYFYRNEADLFLERVAPLFPVDHLPDTLFILRKVQNDTSIVARLPKL